jgi:DNA-directed RNA polymerase sigma subunit (sigma70/sigma32)
MSQAKKKPSQHARGRPQKGAASGKPRKSDLQSDETKRLQGPLGGALGKLQPVQREVLQLRMGLVDGYPHTITETAAALGLSLADAKDIEARAMNHLREVVPLDRLAKLLDNS